jgi:amino acid adenylation domain-containing protein
VNDSPYTHVSGSAPDDVYVFPMSFAQRRLWFLEQLTPNTAAYNLTRSNRFHGSPDALLLERCLREIVRRHETLRTTFTVSDGEPIQVIAPLPAFCLSVIDLRQMAAEESAHEANRLVSQEAQTPFDLSTGPLMRASLLQLTVDESILLLSLHHIVIDGWSISILYRELSVLYAAFAHGEPSPLPELVVQYADYTLWQKEALQGAMLDSHLAYWRNKLASIPANLSLPADHPRPAIQSTRGATLMFALPRDLSEALQALGRAEGATLFMTLQSALSVLLARYSGQTDIVTGSPVANRNQVEIESLIGFFVNILVLRADLSGDPTFRQLLRQVRQLCLEAYAHQDVPFEMLVEQLHVERDLSRSPFFQVSFVLQNAPDPQIELPGMTGETRDEDTSTAKFDLTLAITRWPDGLRGTWEYCTDLFEAATIQRLSENFQTLLKSIVANPDEHISALQMLVACERQQLLCDWNATHTNFPADSAIHQLFESQVERTPDAAALVFGEQSLSYRELNTRANQLAHFLRARGVGPETRIGIGIARSPDMVVALLAILKAGGAYMPLDPEYPAERLAFMLQDSRVSILLTSRPAALNLSSPGLAMICLDEVDDELRRQPTSNPPPVLSTQQLAYVTYTSGSSGTPKGVSIPHRAVVRLVKETCYADLSARETFLQLAPLAFDASSFEIWGSLLNGGRLVIFPPGAYSLSELGDALRHYQITTLWLTAGLFHAMVDERLADLGGLRQMLTGGDVVSPAHSDRFIAAHPGCRLINGYGPTENATFSCCFPILTAAAGAALPIGRPIDNSSAYILDAHLQPVPIGVVGDLYLGGDGLARGYHNRPDLTAERFIPNPFGAQPGERLYRSGDLARYLPDGNIEYLGRLDQQVKLRGFRIELGEIEAVLAQHSAVQACAVLMREDRPGDKQLAAYVVAQPEMDCTPAELRRFLRLQLPEYMLPSDFVYLPALPLTLNGKLDRRTLAAVVPRRSAPIETYEPPRTPREEWLAGIWADVLGLERVGVNDNFFELGGHSLLAAQIMARMRDALPVVITLADWFASPTIASLARTIESAQGTDRAQPAIKPLPREKYRMRRADVKGR